jgi:cytochrome c5
LENKNQDTVFFTNFSAVMAVLVAIFFICITAAAIISPDHEAGKDEAAAVAERTAPVGKVVTDPDALVAATETAERAPYTGEEIVTKVCGACHGAGVLGAPRIGDQAAWATRLQEAGGVDGVVKIAITGKGAMPPRGGDAGLSDDELRAAVEYMLRQSGQ